MNPTILVLYTQDFLKSFLHYAGLAFEVQPLVGAEHPAKHPAAV